MSKSAFLFPGQGAQYVGMGRSLAQESAAAREVFERANEVLARDLQTLCFEGPEEQLSATDNGQPAIFVNSMAALASLREREPSVVDEVQAAAGLSLGEYTALVFADCLDFEDGLLLVQARGEAMQAAAELRHSGMVSILGLDLAAIETLCESCRGDQEVLQVANMLCPGNVVISGDRQSCHRAADAAPSAGAMKAIPLSVAGAFHTPLMQPAVERLTDVLNQLSFRDARIPVYSNVDSKPHQKAEEIRQLLVQQVVRPVLWQQSMEWLLEDGFDQFWEVGPGRVLRGLLRRISRKIPCENVAG